MSADEAASAADPAPERGSGARAPITDTVSRDFGGVTAMLHPSGFGLLLDPNPALDVDDPGLGFPFSLYHAAMIAIAAIVAVVFIGLSVVFWKRFATSNVATAS